MHEEISDPVGSHAALYSDHPGGLAIYQGRYADERCFPFFGGLSVPSGNDGRVYLCAVDDDGLESGR